MSGLKVKVGRKQDVHRVDLLGRQHRFKRTVHSGHTELFRKSLCARRQLVAHGYQFDTTNRCDSPGVPVGYIAGAK
jgi:hypothetical protein